MRSHTTVSDSTDREEIPVIDPDSIAPPSSAKRSNRIQSWRFSHRLWFSAFFVGLLVIGIGVFFVLPDVVKQRRANQSDSAKQQDSPVESTPAPDQAPRFAGKQNGKAALDKQGAEKVLAELLRTQSELESRGVELWGGAEYQKAVEKASEGDQRFARKAYQPALEVYKSALTILKSLETTIPERLERALDDGNQALDQGKSSKAREKFKLALAIDTENENAKLGLARAGTLDEVLELIEAGTKHEQQNQLDAAQSALQQAVKLEPHAQPAHDALKRVAGKITDRNYKRALQKGYGALTRNQYRTARREFTKAYKIKPGTPEVEDGLAQADDAIRLNTIAEHREKAIALEEQERWREAAEHYKAVLSVDPNIQFARDGKSRSLEFGQLNVAFDRFLTQPSRLASEEPMKFATGLLAQTSALDSKGPKLAEKIVRLENLIEKAKTPVKVLLQSDNQTEVLVYKVGRFGKFATRELMLRPGNYTVVGRRDGFRDVRHQVAVVAGQNIPPVVIRCEEPI